MTETDTFSAWTLEKVAAAIKQSTPGEWIDIFIDRYLAFDKVAVT